MSKPYDGFSARRRRATTAALLGIPLTGAAPPALFLTISRRLTRNVPGKVTAQHIRHTNVGRMLTLCTQVPDGSIRRAMEASEPNYSQAKKGGNANCMKRLVRPRRTRSCGLLVGRTAARPSRSISHGISSGCRATMPREAFSEVYRPKAFQPARFLLCNKEGLFARRVFGV